MMKILLSALLIALLSPLQKMFMYNLWLVTLSFFTLTTWGKTNSTLSLPLNSLFLILLFLILYFIFMNEMCSIYSIKAPNLYKITLWSITFILLMFFSTDNPLMMYFSYEASLIPMILLITGWGYQMERFLASLMMLMYMVMASFPLLSLLLLAKTLEMNNSISLWLSHSNMAPSDSFAQMLFLWLINLSFLVKFPMFVFHLWLPKAHVEAPLSGSMVLAGVLLKMAGYGLIYMKMFSNLNLASKTLALFSMWGGLLTSLFCLYQIDMKVLIAYFSVGHMSMCIASLLLFSNESIEGTMMILLAHGFCSAGLFMCAYIFYLNTATRNMLLSKGGLNTHAPFSKMFFLMLMANMATPPTPNFLGEIKCFTGLTNMNYFFIFPFFSMMLLSVVCSILFYSLTQNKTPLMINPSTSQMMISLYSLLPFSALLFILALLSSALF